MNQLRAVRLLFALVALTIVGLAPLEAQATRTWVSGVGDDANPCSRTAPCKTFAGAISKTASGGEINVLDPGGFGGVTITKSITISSEGFEAGVLVSGTNAIIINAGASDMVVLRGLDIEGLGTGLNGIRFLAGSALHVEKCTINNFTQAGISFAPSGASTLLVKQSIIRAKNAATSIGIDVAPTGAGSAVLTLEDVRLERTFNGLVLNSAAEATARNVTSTKNTQVGFFARGATELSLDNCESSHNGTGIRTNGTAIVRASNTLLFNNTLGLDATGGSIRSFGNNRLAGNTTDGAFTPPLLPQL
jgi:hypothetical protein